MASIRNVSVARAAATISDTCPALTAIGFSHSTGTPASSRARVASRWELWGVAT